MCEECNISGRNENKHSLYTFLHVRRLGLFAGTQNSGKLYFPTGIFISKILNSQLMVSEINSFLKKVIEVYLIYNVLVSGVQHSEVKFLKVDFSIRKNTREMFLNLNIVSDRNILSLLVYVCKVIFSQVYI